MNWENLIVNLECIDSLPTLPTVFMKISQMINDPKVTSKKLAKVIETDPAIAMRLLKIVNSPFFGFSRKIMTIQDAVVLLGFNATRNTIMGISILKVFSSSEDSPQLNMNEFWRHSIGTGLTARFLAGRIRYNADKAFIGGVIHDIGKIVLAQFFPEELENVMRKMNESDISFYEAEDEVYRGSHCDLGSYIADKWNLPLSLIEVIDLHHKPVESTEDPKLVSLIHVANTLSKGLGCNISTFGRNEKIDSFALSTLDLEASTLESWLEDLQEEIEKSQDMLDLLA